MARHGMLEIFCILMSTGSRSSMGIFNRRSWLVETVRPLDIVLTDLFSVVHPSYLRCARPRFVRGT